MICGICKKEKKEDQFNWKKKGIKRATTCRECHNEYLKKHYEKNREKYIKKSRINNKNMVIRNRLKMIEFLKDKECSNCGEKDPVVLEFHHPNDDKKHPVATLLTNGYSWSAIKREIDKCIILCANCHRRETAKEFEWYKRIKSHQG